MSREASCRNRRSRRRGSTDAAERLAAIVDAAERGGAEGHRRCRGAGAARLSTRRSERADRIVAERLRALADELDPPRRRSARSRRG